MQAGEQNEFFTWFVRLATIVLVVASLRLAEDVLLPIAFAALLAFLLSPLVVRLTRIGLPKAAAIIVTVVFAFAVIGGVGWIVTSQAISLVRELPNYEQNLHRKILALKEPHRPVFVSRIATMAENLQRDLDAPVHPEQAIRRPPPTERTPVPVELKTAEPTPWELARELATPALRPLGVAGIVVVFVVAMLFQREDLRDRVIKVVSAGQLNVATQALDDAASRVSRYLGMQLVVNAAYGVPIGTGLFLVGIPNALLWGLLATLLRFIPFLGPWIAAAFPVSLAVAVDPGWTRVLYVLGIFVVMEIVSSNIVEVLVYGATTGISNLALLIAAVFWTWLWGPAGLVLSTPLTVCLLVLGKYVPGLNFLKMLLGSEPVLEPPAQFYHRMLSMESEDMLDLASRYVAEHSLEAFYDEVFLPALVMSEQDRHGGTLPETRQRFIYQSSRELIEELERLEDPLDPAGRDDAPAGEAPTAATQPAAPVVLGLPARDEADGIVALMLSHLLRRRGVATAVQSVDAPFDTVLQAIGQLGVRVVFVSAVPPSDVGAARQASRRIRARFPSLPLVAGLWRNPAGRTELQERLRVVHVDEIVTTLAGALTRCESLLGLAPPEKPVDRPPASTNREAVGSPSPATS
ncbi:MAG TPA: AI-2E family transporter [Opitutaceae bacterium]|nr:AI-2E family transporter [Opitutaceae bacterium]